MNKFRLFVLLSTLVLTSCANIPGDVVTEPNKASSADSWLTDYIPPPSGVDASQVFTFLCEVIVQRPTTLTNTCADFGESVFEIRWNKWDSRGARGVGIYSINQCEPDCASGKRIETPVNLFLDRFTTDESRFFLNYLTITSDNFENDGIYEIWDLSSFYRELPDLRD